MYCYTMAHGHSGSQSSEVNENISNGQGITHQHDPTRSFSLTQKRIEDEIVIVCLFTQRIALYLTFICHLPMVFPHATQDIQMCI